MIFHKLEIHHLLVKEKAVNLLISFTFHILSTVKEKGHKNLK